MKIKFDFKLMDWEGISIEQVKTWQRLYPDVDVVAEIKVNMIRWLDKRKDAKITRKKDWKKFICNWLTRSQKRTILN